MKTYLLWRRFLIGYFLLALLTGCATTTPKSPTPAPTAIPTSTPTHTPEPTVIPTSIPTDTPEPTVIPTSTPTHTPKPTVTPLPFVEGTEFPVGLFESASSSVAFEFREDGTWRCYSQREGWEVSGKYGVNGNLFSEMTHYYPIGRQVPATYYWTFDGKTLIFQLWGKDLRPHRKSVYDGQTYLLSGETEVSSKVEGVEFPTGKFVLDGSRFYAIEFNEDGTWRDYDTDVDSPTGEGKYTTNGDLYTEMTHSDCESPKIPATYYWTYDGKNLTFELWGEDVNPYRKALFDGQTYIKAE